MDGVGIYTPFIMSYHTMAFSATSEVQTVSATTICVISAAVAGAEVHVFGCGIFVSQGMQNGLKSSESLVKTIW